MVAVGVRLAQPLLVTSGPSSPSRLLMPSSAQPLAYSPVQTSEALSSPLSISSSLRFSFVTTVGTNSCDGVSNSVVFAAGGLPWANAYATSAAASATILIGLEIVLYWSPLTIRWAAASSASLPETGGTGVPGGLERGDRAAAGAVVGGDHAVDLALEPRDLPETQSWALAGAQSGRVELGQQLEAARVDRAVHALLDQAGRRVGRRAVDLQDAAARVVLP